jgi:uncharacterized membrane protein YjgN (DUF898 family)
VLYLHRATSTLIFLTALFAVQALVEYYGDRLAFGLHRFPLPYHHNAFYAWQAVGAVHSMLGLVPAIALTNQFFSDSLPNQSNFTNDATSKLSQEEVIALLARVAAQVLSLTDAQVQNLLGRMAYGSDDDESTRASWKYGCSRGITGTPSFLLNGVAVQGQPDWTLKDWQAVIDPVLQ